MHSVYGAPCIFCYQTWHVSRPTRCSTSLPILIPLAQDKQSCRCILSEPRCSIEERFVHQRCGEAWSQWWSTIAILGPRAGGLDVLRRAGPPTRSILSYGRHNPPPFLRLSSRRLHIRPARSSPTQLPPGGSLPSRLLCCLCIRRRQNLIPSYPILAPIVTYHVRRGHLRQLGDQDAR